MHDGVDVGPRLEDFAVQVALAIDPPAARVYRLAGLHAEFEYVVCLHQRRRHGARQQKTFGIGGGANADMTKTVEDAFVHQDFIGQYKIGDCLGVSGHCCSASLGHELSYAKATKCLWYLNGVLADDRPVFKRCPAAAIVRLTRSPEHVTLRLASRNFSALRSGHDPDLLGECEKNLTAPNQDAYRTLAKPV